MKKMKTILLATMFCLIGATAFSQTTVRMRSETIGFFTMDADTMHIIKSDNVVKASVYCPSFATDSVIIKGCTFTIDGIPTDSIIVPPGEASFNIGFDYAVLDTLTIEAVEKAWVMLLIDRE